MCRSLSAFSSGCFWGQTFAVGVARAACLVTHQNEAVMLGRIYSASPLLCDLGLIGGCPLFPRFVLWHTPLQRSLVLVFACLGCTEQEDMGS